MAIHTEVCITLSILINNQLQTNFKYRLLSYLIHGANNTQKRYFRNIFIFGEIESPLIFEKLNNTHFFQKGIDHEKRNKMMPHVLMLFMK